MRRDEARMMPYLQPVTSSAPPRGLSLVQFLQTVVVGVSGLDGTLVRPLWQRKPPKNPDVDVNWIGMGIDAMTPEGPFGYLGVNSDDETISQRHELLEVSLHIYGPDAIDIVDLIRDGFQVPNNLEALRSVNMGFVESGLIRHLPDLVNEQWIDRALMSLFFRREIQRVYPIATLMSASGVIHTVVGNEPYLLDWATES